MRQKVPHQVTKIKRLQYAVPRTKMSMKRSSQAMDETLRHIDELKIGIKIYNLLLGLNIVIQLADGSIYLNTVDW